MNQQTIDAARMTDKIKDVLKRLKKAADTGPDGEFCVLTSEECILVWRLLTLTKQV